MEEDEEEEDLRLNCETRVYRSKRVFSLTQTSTCVLPEVPEVGTCDSEVRSAIASILFVTSQNRNLGGKMYQNSFPFSSLDSGVQDAKFEACSESIIQEQGPSGKCEWHVSPSLTWW